MRTRLECFLELSSIVKEKNKELLQHGLFLYLTPCKGISIFDECNSEPYFLLWLDKNGDIELYCKARVEILKHMLKASIDAFKWN